jgi:SAM-dependent methyltransferase
MTGFVEQSLTKEKVSFCTACSSDDLSTILEHINVPVHQNLLYDSLSAALNCTRGNLRLENCRSCGLVFNSSFQSELLEYAQDFENSQDNSPLFMNHLREIAQGLTHTYALEKKRILEIGCGKAGFLKLLTAYGGNEGIGFDPSYDGELSPQPGLQFVRDFFPGDQPWWNPDLIVCRHVLEHIQAPHAFLAMLRQAIGHRSVPIYLEVPNVSWIFKNEAFWDIFYEHCNYFSAQSIGTLLRKAGFEIRVIRESFADQYLSIEAYTKEDAQPQGTESICPSKVRQPETPNEAEHKTAADFQKSCISRRQRLIDEIGAASGNGQTIAVWGAAAKGSTFLNLMNISRQQVQFVVDINPKKQGCFIAGTGHQIVAPDHLLSQPAQTILLMNPNYHDEVTALLQSLGAHSQLVCV